MEGRQSSQVKVWVNGTFDVLHRGHLELLEFASSFGEVRVGVDYDSRVKELKGDSRPVNTWSDRCYFLSRIVGLDSVVGFGTDFELEEQIRKWSPYYLIVGSDYKNKNIIGSQYVGKVIYFDRVGDYSTTKILNYESISDR